MINVLIKENYFWKKFSNNSATIYFKGYLNSHSLFDMVGLIENIDIKDIASLIKSFDGNFALVVVNNKFTFICVDKIRSSPLFFTKIDSDFYIDCLPNQLINQPKFIKSINNDAVLELCMSGYTIGNKTIYNNLFSLKAGEIVVFKENEFEYQQFYKYFDRASYLQSDYVDELSKLTIKIFQKMINGLEGRQVIVPLSAGNDSRLVVSILKHLGVTNVKCYSYGTINNFESNTAKLIAEKLGYEWIFIPLTNKSEKKYYLSDEYNEYLNFADTCSSVPHFQSLSTIKYLKDLEWIDDDAIFINGNSGDFITGLHINYFLKDITDTEDVETRKDNILNSLINKHFSLWGNLKLNKNLQRIKRNIWKEISSSCGGLENKSNDHALYEYSEFIDRQSKYVISGQRSYEFYGYEWRLPLWDDEYLNFWSKIPLDYKKDQKLYLDMLKKYNFGEVWGNDIPINKKTITPKWIIPLRFLAKIPFALFGKNGKSFWHKFETIFFYYWMDNTKMMSSVPYLRVIKSIRNSPQHHVSWQVLDYIKKNNIKIK